MREAGKGVALLTVQCYPAFVHIWKLNKFSERLSSFLDIGMVEDGPQSSLSGFLPSRNLSLVIRIWHSSRKGTIIVLLLST